eukprot:6360815-Pyramimonas_sp.AAC.1
MAAVRAARSFFQFALDQRYASEVAAPAAAAGMNLRVQVQQAASGKKDKIFLVCPFDDLERVKLMFAGA